MKKTGGPNARILGNLNSNRVPMAHVTPKTALVRVKTAGFESRPICMTNVFSTWRCEVTPSPEDGRKFSRQEVQREWVGKTETTCSKFRNWGNKKK